MQLQQIQSLIPKQHFDILTKTIKELRPSQSKAVDAGLLDYKSLLVCTPTASGKTLIAELAMLKTVLEKSKKAIYIVPLKALASEKYREFKKKYEGLAQIARSIGDNDLSDSKLHEYDIILTTSEKLDSLLRHKVEWVRDVGCIVIDEIHLLNDPGRGPTLEILLTILRTILKDAQLIGLSATIGNPQELADWLDARLVQDNWRPVKLYKGLYHAGEIEFVE